MQTLFIDNLSGNAFIRAACWTLVHSLWQGLLLAVAGGAIVLVTKKHHPALRYNLLAGLFFSFLITAAITFILQFQQAGTIQASDTIAANPVTAHSAASFSKNLPATLLSTLNNLMIGSALYFDRHAAIIVTIWFIVFSTRLFKIFAGLNYIRHIRHRRTQAPDDYWKKRIAELQVFLRIRKPVRLMESGIIQVPMAVGWLKPLILVPIGFLTHLPPEQLEAILLHELAHIKRRDYFVNLAQSFAEVIFFFHPAVLWISSLIREERENCCDDMAIAVTKNKTKFVHALVTFHEYNSSAGYAMAFPGRKNQLLNRVKRIIQNSNSSLGSIEKACIVSCCFLIGLLFVFVSSSWNNSQARIVPVNKARQFSSTPAYPTAIDSPEVHVLAGNIPVLPTKKTLPVTKKAASSYNTLPTAGKKAEAVTPKTNDTLPGTRVTLNDMNMQTTVTLDYTARSIAVIDSVYLSGQKFLNAQVIKFAPLQKLVANILLKVPLVLKPSTPYINGQYKPDLKLILKSDKPSPQSNALPDPIIADLIKEKIISALVIKNKEDFSYTLNNEALIVQGVKQAEAIFQKFREKYLGAAAHTTRFYNWKN